MAAGKKTELSIVLRAVDAATATIKRVNDKLAAATKPVRDFREQLGKLKETSGLNEIGDAFKNVGSAIGDLLGKVAMIGGVVGLAVVGVFSLVKEFDDLGDKAAAIGVGADFLASMRYAAERSGVEIQALDQDLLTFTTNLGKMRNGGSSKLAKFLETRSPALLAQLRAAKDNVAAFDLIANAMAKLQDPAKKAALAQMAFGDAASNPLLARGAKGIAELRANYMKMNPDVAEAAAKAGDVDDSLKDLKATTDGVKAAILVGLAPALKIIVDQLKEWFQGHREDIKEFAKQLGERLPDAFNAVVDGVKSVIDFLEPFFDSSTKIKIALVALAAVMAGPLLAAIVQVSIALTANPIGVIIMAIAALAVAWALVITHWDEVKAYFTRFWDWFDEKFGAIGHIIVAVTAPFIYIPAMIIRHWDSIKEFFGVLWDIVKAQFQAAWDFIKAIVDKVTGAVDVVGNAISTVKDALGFGSTSTEDAVAFAKAHPNVPGASVLLGATGQSPGGTSMTKIMVDFTNAPKGTRVKTESQGSADVDVGMGYQMVFAP